MINFPDAPSLNQTFSAVGETWKWDGAKWIAFSAAIAGDITSVNVGTGLSGGGTSGDVTVSLTTPVTVANGGTNATTASAALTNLGALPLVGGTISGSPGALGVSFTLPADTTAGCMYVAGNIVNTGGGNLIGSNVYAPSTGGFKYAISGYGSLLASSNGGWNWYTAPSGTAGTAATLTQTMSLDASGNLRVYGTGAAALLTDRGNQSNYISLVANGGQFQIGNQVGNLAYWDSGANFTIQGGTATKPGGGSWVAPSDRALKSAAEAWPTGLAEVLRLEPISYRYNEESWNHADTDHIGLDAEDAAAVIPEMARTVPIPVPGDPDNPDEPPPSVDVAALDHTPLLFAVVNALKEINARLAALEQALPTATPQGDKNGKK